jgi:hypothetical protein
LICNLPEIVDFQRFHHPGELVADPTAGVAPLLLSSSSVQRICIAMSETDST